MTNDPADVLLQVKGLKKYFPLKKKLFSSKVSEVRAVDGVDFYVRRGETLGIVGESGCGKSTTGQLILRMLPPTAGEIIFDGNDISKTEGASLQALRKHMQIIFQDPFASLNPRMRVKDIVTEPLKIHGMLKRTSVEEKAAELLEAVGLGTHHLNRFPHEFSGGQRQRIGIARALSVRPKLIVCDEPVSALDVSIQAQILNLLTSLQKEFNLTYVFIGHGLPAVKHVSDRIAVMYLGRIVELAERDQLFRHPLHPYTEALLSAVPVTDPSQRRERIILRGDLPNPANPPTGCRFHTRCPYVQERCRSVEPEYKEVVPGHWTACHYPLQTMK